MKCKSKEHAVAAAVSVAVGNSVLRQNICMRHIHALHLQNKGKHASMPASAQAQLPTDNSDTPLPRHSALPNSGSLTLRLIEKNDLGLFKQSSIAKHPQTLQLSNVHSYGVNSKAISVAQAVIRFEAVPCPYLKHPTAFDLSSFHAARADPEATSRTP